MLDKILSPIMSYTDWIWGWPILILFAVAAFFYTISLKCFQFTHFGFVMKNTLGKIFSKERLGEGTITPFQAAASALASTLGTGNIAGVAVAVSLGGPGAIFWMWAVASLALILKYAEITLAVKYREKRPGETEYRGGFMYMLINACGSKWKWLAVIFAVFMAFEMALGPAVQSNAVASTVLHSFNIPVIATGVVCAVLAAVVLIGGIKRIAQVADKVVPLMAVLYFAGALVVIALHITAVPAAFVTIFSAAFGGAAAGGGFAGATVAMAIRHGLARGVCAHEAGMGTAPFAHSQAITDDPARQGLWGIFEVFVSTFIVCTSTGLVLVTTGILETGVPGASLVAQAFGTVFPGSSGDILVSVCLILFAFTTMIVNAYYGEKCFEFLVNPKYMNIYRLFVCGCILMGAVGGLRQVWGLMDTTMSVTVIINLLVVLALRKQVAEATTSFLEKMKREAKK